MKQGIAISETREVIDTCRYTNGHLIPMLWSITMTEIGINCPLNPSAWECQSAALGYNYHTARQSGAATVQYNS